MMAKKYRKKPVVIEAIQWDEKNTDEIIAFVGENYAIKNRVIDDVLRRVLFIKTLEGDHLASPGDFIIKGIKGEFYPCKPDIFEKSYEGVE